MVYRFNFKLCCQTENMYFCCHHQYILELCRTEQIVDQDLILSHLEELKPQQPDQVDVRDCRFHFNSLMLFATVKAYLLVSYTEEDM